MHQAKGHLIAAGNDCLAAVDFLIHLSGKIPCNACCFGGGGVSEKGVQVSSKVFGAASSLATLMKSLTGY